MMSNTLWNNPIAWAHFKVRGGLRNHLWSTGGFIVVICGAITVTERLSVARNILSGWTAGLLGLEMAVLLFFGCSSIGNAIRRDITAGLLESHRLMPISPAAAILGYLTGPTLQALLIAGACFFIGTATATMGGVPIDRWLMGNLTVALFALFLWITIAFSSFLFKNSFTTLVAIILPAITSGGSVVEMLPGLRVLLAPVVGGSIFQLAAISSRAETTYIYTFLAQAAFAAIFFKAAMRRYRRDDVPAISTILGLLLIAAWSGTSALGILHQHDFNPAWWARRRSLPAENTSIQIISTLLLGMLAGIPAMIASARAMGDWTRTLVITHRRPGNRPIPPEIVAVAAVLILLPLLALAPPTEMSKHSAAIHLGITMTTYFLGLSYLLRIYGRAGRSPLILLAIWFVLTWIIPFAIDALLQGVGWSEKPLFALISPWGTLINIWSTTPTDSMLGLIVQCTLCGVLGALFYSSEPKARPAIPAPSLS
jgi:hypothetical protein